MQSASADSELQGIAYYLVRRMAVRTARLRLCKALGQEPSRDCVLVAADMLLGEGRFLEEIMSDLNGGPPGIGAPLLLQAVCVMLGGPAALAQRSGSSCDAGIEQRR